MSGENELEAGFDRSHPRSVPGDPSAYGSAREAELQARTIRGTLEGSPVAVGYDVARKA